MKNKDGLWPWQEKMVRYGLTATVGGLFLLVLQMVFDLEIGGYSPGLLVFTLGMLSALFMMVSTLWTDE